MSYINITDKKALLLKDFREIQDDNGKYIKAKHKKSKIIVSKYNIEQRYRGLPIKERVICFKNILKKTHEYRIKKLYDLQQDDMYKVFLCIKTIEERENSNFIFKVSSHIKLIEQLIYLLTDTQKVFINKEIYNFFDENTNDNKSMQQIINYSKLEKIQQDDFNIVINKILNAINSPKEFKYMLNMLHEIATRNLFDEKIINSFYKIINNKLIKYLNRIIRHDFDKMELNERAILKQIHSCLVIAHEQKQVIPKKMKKQLLNEILLLYDCLIKSINFDMTDVNFIRKQKFLNENLINNIIKEIIATISDEPEKISRIIDKKYEYKRNLSNSIINQAQNSVNSLEYFILETNKCFNLLTETMQKMVDLTLKIDGLKQEASKISNQDSGMIYFTLQQHRTLSRSYSHQDRAYNKINNLIDIFKKKLNHITALADSYTQEHSILRKHLERYNVDPKDLARIGKYFNISNIVEYIHVNLFNKVKLRLQNDNSLLINTIKLYTSPEIVMQDYIIKLILVNATINNLNDSNIVLTNTNFDKTMNQIKNCYIKYLEVFYTKK